MTLMSQFLLVNQKHTTKLVYSDSNDSYEPVLISESKIHNTSVVQFIWLLQLCSFNESETYHKSSVDWFKRLLWASSYKWIKNTPQN